MSDDLRFDQLLRENASALPPAMAEVNPWREAMWLVLWGMGDPALLPGLLDGLPGWVPQLQLHQVEKASHWIVHEHPERVAMELGRFLQSKQ